MRRAVFAALLAASLHAAAQDTKAIFVYSAGTMTPLAQLTPQGIRNFGPKNGDDDEANRWFAPWFAAGRSYHYLGNDGARGTGTSAGPFSDAGLSVAAEITLDGPSGAEGLLTNFPLPDKVHVFARPASAHLDKISQRIARGVLLRQGVAPDLADKALAGTGNAAGNARTPAYAIPTHGHTPAMIVSSYAWDSTDAAYAQNQQPVRDTPFVGFTLTLILEADSAQRYHASHVIFQRADSESTMSYFDFFTTADLDGDGRDEIILKGSGYEWWWYEIFGKRKSHWKSLAAGGGGGV
jgi:hypothetical protein